LVTLLLLKNKIVPMVLGLRTGSQIHVLLVEDDADDIDFMMMALADDDAPYDVITVTDGEKALQHLSQSDLLPDVVVLDLNLPKIDGREVLKALKADKRFASVPVLVHTTSKSERDIAYCQSFAVDRYITKTTSLEGLKTTTKAIRDLACH
jgi:CheY-like chemotaxis protein